MTGAPEPDAEPVGSGSLGPGAALTLLWLASTVLRFIAGRVVPGPVIFTDEISYWQAARSFHESGQYLVMGEPLGIPNVLYSTLLSPLFALSSTDHIFLAAKLVGSGLVSLVVFAAYALAREVLPRAEATYVAVLSAAIPAGAYSATIMADNLFYPVLVATMWLLHRTLARGDVGTAIAGGGGLVVGFFTKPNIAMLAAAYGITLLLWTLEALWRRPPLPRLARRLAARVTPLLMLGLAIGGRVLASDGAASTSAAAFGGLYTNLASATSVLAHVRPLFGLVAVLLISTLWSPLFDLLGGVATLRSESAERRWFWLLTASTTAAFVLVVAHYALKWQTPDRVFERYVFAISPALFAWHFVHAEREPDAFRRVATPVLAIAFVALVLALGPTLLTGNYAADSPSLTAFAWVASSAVAKPRLATALFALLVMSAAIIGSGVADGRWRTTAWLALLLFLNAGWYGWQASAAQAARENGRLADVIRHDLAPTGAVLVVSDSLPRNLIAATSFWLPRGVELISARELLTTRSVSPSVELVVAGRDVPLPLEVAGSVYDGRALIYRNPGYGSGR